jgi:phosphoglycolate phosphatase
MPITTVIFDFDGTLASSLEGIWTCMSETFARFHFPQPTLEQVRATVGLTLETSIDLLTENRATRLGEMVAFYRSLHDAKAAPLTRLFDGAVPALAQLRSQKICTILVSNKGRAGLHQLVSQLHISTLLDVILSAQDVAFPKPDARLFTTTIAPLLPDPSAPPSHTLMVGDTETDILFAKNAGLVSCWAAWGYGTPGRCRSLWPDYELNSLAALPALLATIDPV